MALASAGLLIAIAAAAQDPPFQTPSAAKPSPPPPSLPLRPLFDDDPAPGSPSDPPAAPPSSPAPSPPSGAPAFGPVFEEGTPSGPSVAAPLPPPAPPAVAMPPRILPIETLPEVEPEPPRKAPRRAVAARPQRSKKAAFRGVSGPIATYPGFRMLEDGGSRVFVKISGKVGVSEQKVRGRVVFRLEGVSVPSRTNRLPLDTSFFATPVSQIRLVPQEEGASLVVELREASVPVLRVEEQADGVVLILDFPRWTGAIAPATLAQAEPARSTRTMRTTRIGASTGSARDFP